METTAAFSATEGIEDTSTRIEYASEYYYRGEWLNFFAKKRCRVTVQE